MFNRYKGYNNKLKKELRCIPFSAFGITAKENFDITDISKHIKIFRKRTELEAELNKLTQYIYEGKRKIVFHEFRQFPYIQHGDDNTPDICGLAQNYTSSDVYLIKFIRKFLLCKKGKYVFFDVDFIINNTNKIGLDECYINEMFICEILR